MTNLHNNHGHSKMEHDQNIKEEPGVRADHENHNVESKSPHTMHVGHAAHEMTQMQSGGGHAGHVDHSGHEDMFRKRFWISLVLSFPVLLYTPMLQMWFGFRMPEFVGSQWVAVLFAVIVFAYGGVPFIQMAVAEIGDREPRVMIVDSPGVSRSLMSIARAHVWQLCEGLL